MLRARAQALKPVVTIGAAGLTDTVLTEIACHLDAHRLIKIRVEDDSRDTRETLCDEICDRLDAAPIQHIGKLLVIWKPEPDTASDAHGESADGAPTPPGAPRVVKVFRRAARAPAIRRAKLRKVVVAGNERVTAGGIVKRAKPRQQSAKRRRQKS